MIVINFKNLTLKISIFFIRVGNLKCFAKWVAMAFLFFYFLFFIFLGLDAKKNEEKDVFTPLCTLFMLTT